MTLRRRRLSHRCLSPSVATTKAKSAMLAWRAGACAGAAGQQGEAEAEGGGGGLLFALFILLSWFCISVGDGA